MLVSAEAEALAEATGSRLMLRGRIAVANWRGHDAEAVALTKARQDDVRRRGEGLWFFVNDWGSALRYNGLGRYATANGCDASSAASMRAHGSASHTTCPCAIDATIWLL
ncbi:hypothetical protein ACQPZX_14280 [Actinoplanes sp. CA-142083]|uniref:hypothetical protein n=1 Tax=Actinoplanes sp. CA-142083 TaxID=3239903 RepID=UPI003D8C8038